MGGKIGNCVPPACPFTIPLSPPTLPRPPALALAPTQPCSCPSFQAPADPSRCSPLLPFSTRVQQTCARLGTPQSLLVGMLLLMSPRQWVDGWIGTGMRGTQPIGWP